MTKPPTVRDVARLSGVSTATVSRYFGGKVDAIAPHTVENVRKAAEALGYTPSEIGRSLRLARSNVVVMMVPDATNHFTADDAASVDLVGYSQGAAVMDVIGAIPVPGIGFNNPLPPEAAGHVAAIAVFGNPSAKLGLPLTASPVWGGKVIDLCNAGDPICQTDGQSVPAHKSYAGGPTNEAANFVAGLL